MNRRIKIPVNEADLMKAEIMAKRLNRFKLNNEGVALIYALMAGTVAMVFCLMLLMISYSLYAQVSANNSDMQLKLAAETFAEALHDDLEYTGEERSSMTKYLAKEINNAIVGGNKEDIELIVYDPDEMGNYCIYLLIQYDKTLTVAPSKIDLDIVVKCIKGVPYVKCGDNYIMIDDDGQTKGYILDDRESYTIKDTCTLQL